jgi:hypothetical protein
MIVTGNRDLGTCLEPGCVARIAWAESVSFNVNVSESCKFDSWQAYEPARAAVRRAAKGLV